MGQWNHELLARLIAPRIADFTTANLPDVATDFPQLDYWIANAFLSFVFGIRFVGKHRILIHNVIYRAQLCLQQYDLARHRTTEFLNASQPSNPAIRRYFMALSSWEFSLLSFSIASDNLLHLVGVKLFEKGDGSVPQRTYDLANLVKHHGRTIVDADFIDTSQELLPSPEAEPTVIPLWLDNSGLHSGLHTVSFDEYAVVMRDLGRVAESLTNPADFFAQQEDFIKQRKNRVSSSSTK